MNFKRHLGRLLAVGGVESLGVVIGGVAGLLIVNVLPKDQYAQYTFLVSCLTLMHSITDTGLAHTCLPIVGQRAHEVPWVIGACRHVFRYRWWLLMLGFVFVVPYWVVTSQQHGWNTSGYWLATALVAVALLFSMRVDYAATVLTILGYISSLTRVGFYAVGARTALVLAVVALPVTQFSLSGFMAATLLAAMINVWFYSRAFKSHSLEPVRLSSDDAKKVNADLIRIAKPLMLPAIFYQFQGVVTVFIVSLFGTAEMLAEVGALGRLTMMLVVFDKVAGVLVFPVIAKAAEGKQLMNRILLAHALTIGGMALVLLSALIFPQYWMLLLGPQYKGQQDLLWMAFLATLLISCANFAFVTLTSRGNTGRQTLIIPFVLLAQVACVSYFGVDTLRDVLALGIATSLAHFVYQYTMLIVWFNAARRERERTGSTGSDS